MGKIQTRQLNPIQYMNNKILILVFTVLSAVPSILAQRQVGCVRYSETNTVSAITNIKFFLTSRRADLFPAMEFKPNDLIFAGVCQPPGTIESTNRQFDRFLLFPNGQSFEYSMFDAHGKEVPKRHGQKKIEDVVPPDNYDDFKKFKAVLLGTGEGHSLPLFRPDQMFEITNSGTYTIEFRMRILVSTTNGFPDYRVIQNLKQYYHPPYGMVVSEPLRVKIINE